MGNVRKDIFPSLLWWLLYLSVNRYNSRHGGEEVQPVVTSSLPKIQSLRISSELAIFKSKYS